MKNALFLLYVILTPTFQDFSTDFPPENLKSFGDMTLKWKRVKTDITIQVEKSSEGFGAVGFGTSVMEGANIIFFDKINPGEGVNGVDYRDCKSYGYGLPRDCKRGTWTVVHSFGDQNSFKIELKRPMDDKDPDTFIFAEGAINFIWAQGTTDVMTRKHSRGNNGRGLFIIEPEKKEEDIGEELKTGVFSSDFPLANSKNLGDMVLKWKVVNNDRLVIQVEKQAPGFGAIGFGTKIMKGSNIIFFDKVSYDDNVIDGVKYTDCQAIAHMFPKKCKVGTWIIVHSEADPNFFKIELTRKYNDGDDDTYDFSDGIIPIIWAQGWLDLMDDEHTTGNFGKGTIILPEGTGTLDLKLEVLDDDAAIRNNETALGYNDLIRIMVIFSHILLIFNI